MVCRIPGCSTRYWNRDNNHPMFKASSEKQLKDWQEILRLKGVVNFGQNDLVCVLHFEETNIERERIIYQSGGIVSKKPRKILLLTPTAVPTIFPTNVSTIPVRKYKKSGSILQSASTLGPEVFAQSREMLKQRLSLSVNTVPSDDAETPNQPRKNDLFQLIVDGINEKRTISPYLNKFWICNVSDQVTSVTWSIWNADRSGIERCIILHDDLEVNVFADGKKICLPQLCKVEKMCDLHNVFKEVSRIKPCKTAEYDSEESRKACRGYVIKNSVGRQKLFCSPCNKYMTNAKRRMRAECKIHSLRNIKHNLRVKCNKLRHKSQRLQIKLKALKKTVTSLKQQCQAADKTALDKAIEKLTFNEQAGIKACFAASKLTDMRGMRYTTQWVYECVLLRIKSKKAYEHLRNRRILVLPDISTLNRYIKRIGGCYGFQDSLFKVIAEKTKRMKLDEVRGTLLIDEMKLTKALSFNRQNLKVVGFTDLGRYTPKHQRGKKGDHALVFMFQPFKGKWVQSIGCFLSKGSATGTVLHQLIIECISLTEKSGLKVDAVATDGASWNRTMWKIFGVTKESVSIPHILDSKRRLWFLSDFPHLIKCFRNFITHPDRSKDVGVFTPDGIVQLSHWYAVFKVENENGFNLKVNYKLREEHLNPKYFQKMNVAIAFQFFGLADAMELFRNNHCDLTNCGPSIQFSRRIKSLITAMNSRTPINNLKPGNEMWKIIKDFIVYLDEWETEAKRNGYDFLPDSTCYGLQISLRAALEICQFLVTECDFSYLMTARLNQDSLERFFGMMRHCCGSNEHPDSILFIQMYRLVSTYSLVKPPKGSNITGGEILDVLIKLKDITDADERWEQWTGQIDTVIDKGFNCDQLLDAVSLLEEHDYFVCSTSDYVLTYIAGFVARKSSRFVPADRKNPCKECTSSLLLDPTEEIPESHKLIKLRSHGYLKHPSASLFALISLLENGTLNAIGKKDLNAETLFDITEAIQNLTSAPLVGCSKHEQTLTHRVITFYLTTRMYFLCKQANKNDSIERDTTREKRKLSKLAYAPDVTYTLNKNTACNQVSQNCKTLEPPIAKKPARKMKKQKL